MLEYDPELRLCCPTVGKNSPYIANPFAEVVSRPHPQLGPVFLRPSALPSKVGYRN
jgi:hypothetical protein